MPAGSLIFPDDSATLVALEAAGEAAGVFFERGLGLPRRGRSSTRRRGRHPRRQCEPGRIGHVLVVAQIFGPDVGFVSVASGTNSLQNAATDPLESFDVIYNAGQTYPTGNTARARLRAFFERGGGYIATSQVRVELRLPDRSPSGADQGQPDAGQRRRGGGIALWTT